MGYVYALQFDDLSIKVGQAADVGKRIARHKAEAARFGRAIVQTWTAWVYNARIAEGHLIDLCASHGTARPGTREYFVGVPWDTGMWDKALPPGTAGVPHEVGHAEWDGECPMGQSSVPRSCPWDACPTNGTGIVWDSECPSRDLCHRNGTAKPSHTGQREGSSGWDWELRSI